MFTPNPGGWVVTVHPMVRQVRLSFVGLTLAASTAALVACGGGSSEAENSGPTAEPPGFSGGPAAAAAIANTCALLTDGDLAPLGKPDTPGRQVQPASGGGVTTAVCHWDLNGNATLDLTVYVFDANYNGSKDFARPALESAASDSAATVQPVAGVGDYAGVAVPESHGSTSSANFLAQKGTVAFKLKFAGSSAAATWPTADQLQALGKAVAAKVFPA